MYFIDSFTVLMRPFIVSCSLSSNAITLWVCVGVCNVFVLHMHVSINTWMFMFMQTHEEARQNIRELSLLLSPGDCLGTGLSLVQKLSARLASQRAIRLHSSPLPLTSAMDCRLVRSALAFAGWC